MTEDKEAEIIKVTQGRVVLTGDGVVVADLITHPTGRARYQRRRVIQSSENQTGGVVGSRTPILLMTYDLVKTRLSDLEAEA